jgi:hypothetical protein
MVTLLSGPDNLIGAYSGKPLLVVIGGAANVWDDIDKIPQDADVMAVNYIAIFLRRRRRLNLNHISSLHINVLKPIKELSTKKNERILLHAAYQGTGINTWNFSKNFRLSGIFAALVGVYMGYQKILLAGMPCDASGNFHTQSAKIQNHAFQEEFVVHNKIAWDEIRNLSLSERIRSLSGYTKEIFGGL